MDEDQTTNQTIIKPHESRSYAEPQDFCAQFFAKSQKTCSEAQ
jgi:hypothetical protein